MANRILESLSEEEVLTTEEKEAQQKKARRIHKEETEKAEAEAKESTYDKSYEEAVAGLKPDQNPNYRPMSDITATEEEGKEAVDFLKEGMEDVVFKVEEKGEHNINEDTVISSYEAEKNQLKPGLEEKGEEAEKYLKNEIENLDKNLEESKIKEMEEGKNPSEYKENKFTEKENNFLSLKNVSSKFFIDPHYGLKRIEIENYAESLVREIRHIKKMGQEFEVDVNFVLDEKLRELEDLQEVARKKKFISIGKRKKILDSLNYKNKPAENAKSIVDRIRKQNSK